MGMTYMSLELVLYITTHRHWEFLAKQRHEKLGSLKRLKRGEYNTKREAINTRVKLKENFASI